MVRSQRQRQVFKNDVPASHAPRNIRRFWKSRNLRPHLQRIRPSRMTVGGWFDARTCSVRRDLPPCRGNKPRDFEHSRDGSVAPRRLEQQRRRFARRHPIQLEPSLTYRENIEFPFFEYHLNAMVLRSTPRLGCRDGYESVATTRLLATEKSPAEIALSALAVGFLAIRLPSQDQSDRATNSSATLPNQ